jgi:hypothetical protein
MLDIASLDLLPTAANTLTLAVIILLGLGGLNSQTTATNRFMLAVVFPR